MFYIHDNTQKAEKPFFSRTIFYFRDQKKVRQFSHCSYDNEKIWQTEYDLIHIKKNKFQQSLIGNFI